MSILSIRSQSARMLAVISRTTSSASSPVTSSITSLP